MPLFSILKMNGAVMLDDINMKLNSKSARLGTTVAGVFLSLVLLLGLVGGCKTADDTNPDDENPVVTEVTYPLTVTDQLGRIVTILSEPQTIVSLSPSNTETIYAMGFEDKLVGVTTYCNYPEAAKDKPKVGGFSNVDAEAVTAIGPDIILASNIHASTVIPQLEQLGLTVIAISPDNLEDVLASIELIGKCLNQVKKANSLVDSMQTRIDAVTSKVKNLSESQKPRVLYIVWHEPLMSVGSTAFITGLITAVGGVSITADSAEAYPTIGLETVLGANPQVVVVGTGMGSGADAPLLFIQDEPRLANIDARINGNIYSINTDLIGRTGPRIVEALEQLAKMLHPEIFGAIS
nr:cobalamin-binding protein [Dehalococcoides mccartyi]